MVPQRRAAGVAGVPRGGGDSPGPPSASRRPSTVGSIAAVAEVRVYAATAYTTTAIVAALIYIGGGGGGTANSIMFWKRDELTLIYRHTHKHAQARGTCTRTLVYYTISCTHTPCKGVRSNAGVIVFHPPPTHTPKKFSVYVPTHTRSRANSNGYMGINL